MICVQSIKHLHRALVACFECAGFLTVRHGPAKPPNISPEHVQPLSVLSFYNPVSVFNKICNASRKKNPLRVRNAKADGEAWAAFPGRKEAALAEGSGAAGCLALSQPGWRGTVLPAPGLGTHWGCSAGQRGAVRTKRGLSCLA